ncbi:hypothetical protein TSUD_351520 [Trifolium subterraneum]|uniref:Malectin-like domain-containing protein n=1 Tax=Trifolium subterraneum TaxID=3900 RepID=A0A2Z6P1F1_TRISU|nr:hypothetical protein TSUD_351520 [Trifolium subterraneum]
MRNCYTINVTSGTRYLIRATFFYGNYDGLNKPPQFDLHLGTNVWDTVKLFSNELPFDEEAKYKEIIYTASLDYIYIQLCLVNTGKGTPFISAIELRPLNNEAYVLFSELSTFSRYDLGSNREYRYKDDVYDRIWEPYELSSDWRQLNASLNNDELVQNIYKPPAIVMSTAVTPVNASAPLQFHWDADNVNDQYYICLHYTEVEKLAGNETRAFNITLNGDFWYGPVIPKYREAHTLITTISNTGSNQISLLKTEMSTLPPILNAIEIYKRIDFSQSETLQDDVIAMTNINNAYGVARNWQGDPCFPVNYMWEGLNCSIDGNNISRITSLDLSSSELTGNVASSISKLTMLQHL